VIAAGSSVGVTLSKGDSFPVGKVDFLELMPMTFPKFLMAQNQDVLADWLMSLDRIEPISAPVFDKLKELFREYYIVGGMPEAVQTWCLGKDLVALEKVQTGILNAYYRDFSKYPPSAVIPRILGVWNSVVGQLAKDNRKFMYSGIGKGARAREYETARLVDCRRIRPSLKGGCGEAGYPSCRLCTQGSFKI
jgi:predicted AAA+ superfamily ATPase